MFRLLAVLLVAACADPAPAGDDLPLGDVAGDLKSDDGTWGSALDCKSIPDVPALAQPRITISIDGLTLHLVDGAGDYDRVFPIGPGKIDPSTGESLTLEPVARYGADFTMRPSGETPCKTWWTDPDTGEQSPVFAGLPFLSWSGNYGIHGPIDNFRAPNGGTLRRGFVSHGCVRMEAADIVEVYARVHGVARVPVHVQRDFERTGDAIVDVPDKWIGASCAADSDCNYDGGLCAPQGFCTARCTQYCADRTGYPATFCVADPTSEQGMCVPRATSVDYECRPYEGFAATRAPRFGEPSVVADVCMPQ